MTYVTLSSLAHKSISLGNHPSKDLLLACLEKNSSNLIFHSTLQDARDGCLSSPIYTVALTSDSEAPFSFEHITDVSQVEYKSLSQELSSTWNERTKLMHAIKLLPKYILHLNNNKDRNMLFMYSDIERQLVILKDLVIGSIGKESYADLANIMDKTNQFSHSPNRYLYFKEYTSLAKKYQSRTSFLLKTIGFCMLGLAAIAISTAGIILATSLVGCGLGLLVLERYQISIGKQMHKVLDEFKAHMAEYQNYVVDGEYTGPRFTLWSEKAAEERKALEAAAGKPICFDKLKRDENHEFALEKVYPVPKM